LLLSLWHYTQVSTFGVVKMTTSEKYVNSLTKIKETEERTQKEIDEQKKRAAEELRNFEINVTQSITTAKSDGEKLVESSIEQARKKANAETEKIVEEAKNKAKTISSKIDSNIVKEIIDILLKEV
jgi:vacuolar-type H+-ATPase subunit H